MTFYFFGFWSNARHCVQLLTSVEATHFFGLPGADPWNDEATGDL